MKQQQKERLQRLRMELTGFGLWLASLFLLLSLLSYGAGGAATNWLGVVGFGVAAGLVYLFGLSSYLLIGYGVLWGWRLLQERRPSDLRLECMSLSLLLFSSSLLLSILAESFPQAAYFFHQAVYTNTTFTPLPLPHEEWRAYLGGVPTYYVYADLPWFNLRHLLKPLGSTLAASALFISALLFLTHIEIRVVLEALRALCAEGWTRLLEWKRDRKEEQPVGMTLELAPSPLPSKTPPIFPAKGEPKRLLEIRPKREAPLPLPEGPSAEELPSDYALPPSNNLADPKKIDLESLKRDLQQKAEILEQTLQNFGIEARVGGIQCGPTITSFEVHPSTGVKVQRIQALEKDIALNLRARSIRMIAPIPGKAAVGIEVPNPHPQPVSFKEMLAAYHTEKEARTIPLLLGRAVNGDPVIRDLTKMPHLIIAGATGSGKSVCLNVIIMSILMTARPDEIKLLLVDPKKVELTAYDALPHMIAPVITEPAEALIALNWLVSEMEKRYEVLKQLGFRNIKAFNQRKADREREEALDLPIPERFPYFVAIIDELADLMISSSQDLETPITRIAQMARAVGIHLILATQRPSRDVITGLIKANFPARIAFNVANRLNSQIILDEVGAEKLLNNGDMLLLTPGQPALLRAQGAFVSDQEIEQTVQAIRQQAPPTYLIRSFQDDEVFSLLGKKGGERDALFEEARQLVIQRGAASTTLIQKVLKIGYPRAANLIFQLEEAGVIGPQEGARPRRVLARE